MAKGHEHAGKHPDKPPTEPAKGQTESNPGQDTVQGSGSAEGQESAAPQKSLNNPNPKLPAESLNPLIAEEERRKPRNIAPTPPGPDDGPTGTTVKDAADLLRSFVAAMRAGNIWQAVAIGGELLKIAGEMGFSQTRAGVMAAAACSDADCEDFCKACDELAACKDHCVANAPTIAAGFVNHADSGSPAPLAKAASGPRGALQTFSPNDVLALLELVQSASALLKRLFG